METDCTYTPGTTAQTTWNYCAERTALFCSSSNIIGKETKRSKIRLGLKHLTTTNEISAWNNSVEKTSLKICILELLNGLPCLRESGKTTSLLEEGHFKKLLSFCLVQCCCSWPQDLLRVAKLCHDCKPSNHNNILKKPRQFNSLTCLTLQVEKL